MPIQPGTSPLSFLLARRGIGPAVAPGQTPGSAAPASPSPNPMAGMLAQLMAGSPPAQDATGRPGMMPPIMGRLLSRRMQADPQYMSNLLKQSKLAFAHLIPYSAQTQGTDVSKDLANIYRQIDTVIDKIEKNAAPIQPGPIGMAAAQQAGGMNANITPVNSLPTSGVMPSAQY